MRRRAIAVSALLGLGVLTVAAMPTSVSATPRGPEIPISQRYIVKTTSSRATSGVASDVRRSGAEVRNVYSKALTGFAATLTAAQAQALRADGQVTSVVPDTRVHTMTVQTNPTWGLDRIDQRSVTRNGTYRYTTNGAGVTAFVVDTGIRFAHHQFGGRATSGYDFVGHDTNASDCYGHGTHVSGTIGGSTYGVAKAIKLVSVRVLDCEGSGWSSDIIAGMDWIIAHKPAGPAVVNMSIGGEAQPDLDAAVARTVAAGIPVVVAAGNDGSNACDTSPARVPSAITVAATDSHDTRPEWSNFGSCVDLFAPGVNVRSASITSNTATELMSGTSMATPHVVGVVARYLQAHPTATPAQATTALLAATTPGKVTNPEGSPNRLLFAAPPLVVPGLPTTVTVTKHSSARTATIKWHQPRDTGGKAINAYRVSRNGKDTRGVGPVILVIKSTTRSHTFTHLHKGFSYKLSVRAANAIGAGAWVTKTVKLS